VYPKVSGLSRSEINNTKGYGDKTHYNDPQNSDITAPSGRDLHHLQFSLQAASLETSGYTLALISQEDPCSMQ
jgi:hypothetical protein